MKKIYLFMTLPLWVLGLQAQTAADFMQASKKADVDILFDVNADGQAYKVNWGMDAAWDWDFNVNRGIAHIGKGYFSTGRVSFQPNDLVIDNGDGTYTLTQRQQKKLKWRCDLIKLTGTKEVNLNCDHEALFYQVNADGNYTEVDGARVTDYTGRTNYQGKPEEWYKLIKASVAYVQSQDLKVISVSPFNEPDYVWEQASSETQAKRDFLSIAELLKEDAFFKDIRICGGNTLNDDKALSWYNYLRDYLDEGNTHQLAGSFDNYANFFKSVKEDGKAATADELHNVGEAIVGVNYGMENGIWWGFDSKARGQFCIDSNEGVRLGYGENKNAWTSGAVYRNNATNEVHGYLGSSERQATNSSFAFVSTTKDIFFNGYGPTRVMVYDVPGGTGYQNGQIGAERLFDITWGEDVAPFEVNGTYQIMSYSSGNMLTSQSTSNATISKRNATGTSQLWKVYPGYTTGDMSYWFIDNAVTSNTQYTHLNVLNQNLNSGATVICWQGDSEGKHMLEEQWYVKYAKEGYFYIISRLSNKYLYCSSVSDGIAATLKDGPTVSTTERELKKYLWRFIPTDARKDTKAPAAPTGLVAKQRAGSVELTWTAPEDEDQLTYTILRAEAVDGEYKFNTIGRNISTNTFTDNLTITGKSYIYKVMAVDYAGNRSVVSEPQSAAPLTEKSLVCQLQFDKDTNDLSSNHLNASFNNNVSYSTLTGFYKSGQGSLKLDGKTYGMLPYAVANQDEMTISTWCYISSSSAWQRIFDFGNNTNQYMFFTPSNGSEMCFAMKNGEEEQVLSGGKTITTGEWHHTAITLKPEGGNMHVVLYLDGEKIAERDDFSIFPTDIAPSLCYIGRSMFNTDPMLNGRIDDFRIYNYALSADEVKDILTDLDVQSKDLKDSYEDTTAIEEVKADKGTTNANVWYDLSGRPVNASHKGIIIKKGKKIFSK